MDKKWMISIQYCLSLLLQADSFAIYIRLRFLNRRKDFLHLSTVPYSYGWSPEEAEKRRCTLQSTHEENNQKGRVLFFSSSLSNLTLSDVFAPWYQIYSFSPYQLKEENPDIHHRDAFCQAAELWKTSPDNPKNKDNSGAGPSSRTKEEDDQDEPEQETTEQEEQEEEEEEEEPEEQEEEQ